MVGLIGRTMEMGILRSALIEAGQGRGRCLLFSGEAGIGKTRLAGEFELEAQAAGFHVAWGCTWESGGAPPFWPWIQILRSLPPSEVLTDLTDRLYGVDADLQSDRSRELVYAEVLENLRAATAGAPHVLIFEDLHAADEPSLLLLAALSAEVEAMGLVVLATYRDSPGDGSDAVRARLAELGARHPAVKLVALSADEVAEWLRLAGQESAQEARQVHQASGGNPLFVESLVNRQATGECVPIAAREVIAQRLAGLAPDVQDALAVAAIVGRDFDARAVADVTGGATGRGLGVSALLDHAAEAGILRRSQSHRYRFAHDLVRQFVYESISASRRVRLHQRVASWLRENEGDLFALAHHLLQAAPLDGGREALPVLRDAAAHAMSVLAFEEAERLLEQSLALLAAHSGSAGDSCDALLRLGEARWKAGRFDRAREAYHEASSRAHTAGLWQMSAKALIALADQPITLGKVDWPLVRLIEEALPHLAIDEVALRAGLLSSLAYLLYSAPEAGNRRLELGREAVSLARQSGDAALIGRTLERHCWVMWGPENSEERLAAAIELSSVAAQIGSEELQIRAYFLRLVAHYEIGDRENADLDMSISEEMAYRSRQVDHTGGILWLKAMRALLRGELEAAESLMNEAFLAARPNDRNRVQVYAAQLWVLRGYQGRLVELEPAVRGFMNEHPGLASWRTALAVIHCEQGRVAAAQEELDALAAQGFADLPHDLLWLTTIMGLVQVCAAVGDTKRAPLLYDLLLPYARRNIVLSGGIACYGSAAHYLGLLAVTMERWSTAFAHFEEALRLNRQMQAAPALALAQCEYANALRVAAALGVSVEFEKAAELLQSADATANTLGLAAITRRVAEIRSGATFSEARRRDLQQVIQREIQRPVVAAPTDRMSAGLRRQGAYWRLEWGPIVHVLRDHKGLNYLASLLRQPRRAVPSLELAGLLAMSNAASSNANVELVQSLREELQAAEADNDLGRADTLRRRLDELMRTTLAQLGLAESVVGADSHAERARLKVSRAVARSIEHIGRLDPRLGEHLRTTIKTGRLCVYDPDRDSRVSWKVDASSPASNRKGATDAVGRLRADQSRTSVE